MRTLNNLITASFTVFWTVMASVEIGNGDWFYAGINMSFVLWNLSYLVDKVQERK